VTYSRIGTEQQILNYTIHNNTNDGYKNAIQKRHQMIYIFPIILITLAMMSFLRAAIFYLLARKASLSLHRLLFKKIVNASAKFFSKHYIGNILNRFSEDLLYVDERVPFSMYMILEVRIYLITSNSVFNKLNLGICRHNWNNDSDGICKHNISHNFPSILYTSCRNNNILSKNRKNSETIRNFE
jgi:ABC-type multidrug transport system fused ATPase/permease subunit